MALTQCMTFTLKHKTISINEFAMPKNLGIELLFKRLLMTCKWDLIKCNVLATAILNMQIIAEFIE